MNLILLGAPGAGKGTQAEMICERYGIPAISTGNIIREAVKNETEMGVQAKSFIESGKLVPDEVVIGIIKERLTQQDCQNGFILDGVPRTVPQAEALDKMGVRIDVVLEIAVDDIEIEQRMSGRRVCEGCGSSYHLDYKPPKTAGICDRCGRALIIRKDDLPETVRDRLRVYHEQTEPLKAFYAAKNILRSVRGQETVEDTTKLVKAALEDTPKLVAAALED